MPTGYTAAIKDGISFQEYALGCARAFGALIMMRDDPQDTPIPDEFEPSDYHSNALAEAKAKLAQIRGMTLGEKIAATMKANKDAADYFAKRKKEATIYLLNRKCGYLLE